MQIAGPPREAQTQLAVSTALLAAAALAGAGALVGIGRAIERVDDAALAAQQAQAVALLETHRDRLQDALEATARIGDLTGVTALADRGSTGAIRPDAASTPRSGIDRIVIFDDRDRPVHAIVDGRAADASATAECVSRGTLLDGSGPAAAPPAANAVAALPIARATAGAAFHYCAGEALIEAVLRLKPAAEAAPAAGQRSAPALVAQRRLDADFAAHFGNALKLDALRIVPPGSESDGVAFVALAAADGSETARLQWRPALPMRALFREAAPAATIGLTSLLLLALAGGARRRRASDWLARASARRQKDIESLERMSAMSRIGAWETDATGERIVLSRESARIIGLGDPGPRPLSELLARLTPDCAELLRDALEECLRHGTPFELRAGTVAAPGTLMLRGRQVTDSAEPAVAGTLQDVTEQVAQLQTQRRNTELLERMSRLANIGGWEYDLQKRSMTLTAQSYRIYGFAPDTPVSFDDITRLYAPEDAKRIFETIDRAAREGTSWELELSPTTADGRRIRVRGFGEAERVAGRVRRLFGTLQDTTESHVAAEKLQEAMQSVAQRNAEIQQFTFAASHDLQEPARKVQALGSLLLARYGAQLDAAARDCVQRMQRSCERMSVLVDDVLAFSRIALRPAEARTVDLQSTVAEVADDLESLIAGSGGQLQIGPLPQVAGDPLQIRRLLQNLLANAFRYRHPDRAPEVTVSAALFQPEPGIPWWRLEVDDNGVGFDTRHAEQIFLPFVRLHSGNEEALVQGSGIGLAIVRRIVESHGGRVRAEGRPGVGARFIVELPLRTPPAAGAMVDSAGGA